MKTFECSRVVTNNETIECIATFPLLSYVNAHQIYILASFKLTLKSVLRGYLPGLVEKNDETL